ncbi:hypothetical protein [Cyclobacterium plantarum]|uniref:DUF1574 domain-containing protein n=1 Tax=Cyclobacterium plantarum TaxID=2716263 RepID=A0ABX0HE29_9BACT|nr:hypothetical protein [Cyclobacterium plantarum]NHE58594.1 hypothetical protein [Cyclobacterium plantarum]
MKNKEFKMLISKSIKFLLVFILIEISLGFIAKKIFFSQTTGKYARLTYSIQNNSSEVLIMGSSHANRHFVSNILEKELNMTCYNSGVQGQGLIFQTALLKMILKRHEPKVVILNLDEDWLYDSEEFNERLADLHPYYWDFRKELDPILSLSSEFITFKLLFSSYQTNSTLVHALKYFFVPQMDYKGFRPLNQKMEKSFPPINEPLISKEKNEESKIINKNFALMFEEFINDAKLHNVKLIFTVSPQLLQFDRMNVNSSLTLMKIIAEKNRIPIFDFSEDRTFIKKYHLFNDPGHLNNDGAIIFTKLLANKLQEEVDLIK